MNLQHREAEDRFEAWWQNESEYLFDRANLPAFGDNLHWVKQVAEIASSNGAYCAIYNQGNRIKSRTLGEELLGERLHTDPIARNAFFGCLTEAEFIKILFQYIDELRDRLSTLLRHQQPAIYVTKQNDN